MKLSFLTKLSGACLVLLILFSCATPAFAQKNERYGGLVKCDGVLSNPPKPGEVKCDLHALFQSIWSLITWLFAFANSIALILFIYAGFLYVSGVQKNIDKAKSLFGHVVLGIVIMFCAWFIVFTIIEIIGTKDAVSTSKELLEFKK